MALHPYWMFKQCTTFEEQYCTFTFDQVLRRGYCNLVALSQEEKEFLQGYLLITSSSCTVSVGEYPGRTNVVHTDDTTYLLQEPW